MFARQTVEFSVKGPVSLILDEEQITLPGSAILDINFTRPSQIGELVFRNYYTAWISLLVRYDGAGSSQKDPGWKLAVLRKVLMPSPHHENGSQDIVSVAATESLVRWRKVLGMRLILRQPSPEWRVFHVEELNVFGDLPRLAPMTTNSPFEKYDKLLELVKQQTLKALHWTPPVLNPEPSPRQLGEPSSILPKLYYFVSCEQFNMDPLIANASSWEICSVIQCLQAEGKSAADIHRQSCNMHGANVTSDSAVRDIIHHKGPQIQLTRLQNYLKPDLSTVLYFKKDY